MHCAAQQQNQQALMRLLLLTHPTCVWPNGLPSCSAPGTPRSPLGLPFSAGVGAAAPVGGPMFSAQHPHGRAVRQRVGNVAVNPVGPAAFLPVPVPVPEPKSPLASGLHWADGLAAATQQQQQQQQQQGPAGQASPFLGGGSQVQVLPALEADLPSAFKPMDLEQVGGEPALGQPARQPTGGWWRCCGCASSVP